MSPQITAHSRRSGNVFPLCLGTALRLLGILPSPSTSTRKRGPDSGGTLRPPVRIACVPCSAFFTGRPLSCAPSCEGAKGGDVLSPSFCAPDDSLGALTSTAARSRIFVLACLSPVRCKDGRPPVLRGRCVRGLLRHRRNSRWIGSALGWILIRSRIIVNTQTHFLCDTSPTRPSGRDQSIGDVT